MEPWCSRCINRWEFEIIDKRILVCIYCRRVVYEKKVERNKNKNKHLLKILRQLDTYQCYKLNKLYDEIDKNDISPKTVKRFLKEKGITDYVFYFQFLNKLYNIDFSFKRHVVIEIYNQYLSFLKGKEKNISLKSLLPMIFKYLEIDFCIKPEYSKDFSKFIETLSTDELSELNQSIFKIFKAL